MSIFMQIQNALSSMIESYFSSDMDVMSSEAKEIFSNPEDKKKYLDAINKLRNTVGKEEKIILSNKEEITLVS